MYKIFSPDEISDEQIGKYFVEGTVIQRKHWLYTFPILPPLHRSNNGQTALQPIIIDRNLYYLNAIESVAVAMEGNSLCFSPVC